MSRRGIESSKKGSDLPVVARVFVPAFDGITAIRAFYLFAVGSSNKHHTLNYYDLFPSGFGAPPEAASCPVAASCPLEEPYQGLPAASFRVLPAASFQVLLVASFQVLLVASFPALPEALRPEEASFPVAASCPAPSYPDHLGPSSSTWEEDPTPIPTLYGNAQT